MRIGLLGCGVGLRLGIGWGLDVCFPFFSLERIVTDNEWNPPDLLSKGLPIPPSAVTSSSRGLVTSTTFALFPEITPLTTFSLTLSFITIYMIKLWFSPSYEKFLEGVVLSGMTSFLWGWHVHEKAVLIFLIPLGLVLFYFVCFATGLSY